MLIYSQAQGQPFSLSSPDAKFVFISSPAHLKEINRAHDDELSLHAASKQVQLESDAVLFLDGLSDF